MDAAGETERQLNSRSHCYVFKNRLAGLSDVFVITLKRLKGIP
jgi:hypothetical protein